MSGEGCKSSLMTPVFIGKDMQSIEKYLRGINIIRKGVFYYLKLCDLGISESLFLERGEGYGFNHLDIQW